MKEYFKRGLMSFAIGAFAGLLVNLIIDVIVNLTGHEGFISMSIAYLDLFPTPAMAAYVNILLYGLIGGLLAWTTYIYEVERIGFVIQSIIYFLITSSVCMAITIFLWQLHKYPIAIICTLSGFALTHVLMITSEYRKLKADIKVINELSSDS